MTPSQQAGETLSPTPGKYAPTLEDSATRSDRLPGGCRPATAEDADAIFRLLVLMHAEGGLCTFDPHKVSHTLIRLIEGDGMVFVCIEDDEVVATMGLQVGEDWYSSEKILVSRWVYVHPAHRRSTYCRDLLTAADAAARKNGVRLFANVVSTKQTMAKVRLFSRVLAPVGYLFVGGR